MLGCACVSGVCVVGVVSVSVCSADARIKSVCAAGGAPINKSFHSEDVDPCSSQIKCEVESSEPAAGVTVQASKLVFSCH